MAERLQRKENVDSRLMQSIKDDITRIAQFYGRFKTALQNRDENGFQNIAKELGYTVEYTRVGHQFDDIDGKRKTITHDNPVRVMDKTLFIAQDNDIDILEDLAHDILQVITGKIYYFGNQYNPGSISLDIVCNLGDLNPAEVRPLLGGKSDIPYSHAFDIWFIYFDVIPQDILSHLETYYKTEQPRLQKFLGGIRDAVRSVGPHLGLLFEGRKETQIQISNWEDLDAEVRKQETYRTDGGEYSAEKISRFLYLIRTRGDSPEDYRGRIPDAFIQVAKTLQR